MSDQSDDNRRAGPVVGLCILHRLHKQEGEVRVLLVDAGYKESHLFTTGSGYVGALECQIDEGTEPGMPLDMAVHSLLDETYDAVTPWATWETYFVDAWVVDRHAESTLRHLWARMLRMVQCRAEPSARIPEGRDPSRDAGTEAEMRYRERLRIVEQKLPVLNRCADHEDCLPGCVLVGWLRVAMGYVASYHSTHFQANRDLRRKSFVGRQLMGANFDGANLSGADFTDANLRGANLHGANLEGANMSGADLTSVNLSASHLKNTIMRKSRLSRADFGTAFISGRLNDTDLRGATFAGANFSHVDLSGSNLSGVSLRGARIDHTNLRDTILTSADLSRTDMRNVYAVNADLSRADLTGAEISDSAFSSTGVDPGGSSALFDSAVLRSAHLTRLDLSSCSMKGAVLDDAKLQNVSLQDASLVACSMTGARVLQSFMCGTDYTDADIRKTRFDCVVFSPDTNFTRATKGQTRFFDCRWVEELGVWEQVL